jgi:hypothetical protein
VVATVAVVVTVTVAGVHPLMLVAEVVMLPVALLDAEPLPVAVLVTVEVEPPPDIGV